MRGLRSFAPALLPALLALAGCGASDGSDEGGSPNTTDAGPKDSATPDGGSSSEDAGSADTGPNCDKVAPKLTSTLADVGVPIGAGTAARTFVFDEPVTIAAGGFAIAPSAAITVTPALPATAKSFTVNATGLADGTDYVLQVLAAKTTDACSNQLAADASAKFVSGCAADKVAPTVTSATTAVAVPIGATSVEYDVTFDEPVDIAAGGITASNGSAVAVTPALPAQASTFKVTLSGVVDSQTYDLTVQASGVADRCDNALAANVVVPVVGACTTDNSAPTIVSRATSRRFIAGASTHTFSFSEPVTIAAGGISVDNGGTVTITPALPATATSFKVDVTGLADGTTYNLTASAASIKDVCGNALGASQGVKLVQCAGDTAVPKLLSGSKTLSCNTATHTYTMKFDEGVTLGANAISIGGGATITSVTPPLPALSDTFTIALDNLTTTHDLTIATGAVADECGNASTGDVVISTGIGAATGVQQFDYSGAIVPFVVPSCPLVTFEVWGAAGNSSSSSAFAGGLGARMKGEFTSLVSHELSILVGQKGAVANSNGGGGGSFVVTSANTPLVIAGGGGGSGNTDGDYKHGTTATSGQSCPSGGAGGVDGNGGAFGGTDFHSGAGGGFLTSGADGWTTGTGGKSFLLGGAGGTPGSSGGIGGFGGGGNGSQYVVGGAGGGYSGGGTCTNTGGNGRVGAGGGSFNAGQNQDNTGGANAANGKVVITW